MIRIWDWRQNGRNVLRLKGHSGNIRAIALSSNGDKLLSAGSDSTIRVWDIGMQVRSDAQQTKK
jgi:WD repeat-containing protein 48